MCSSVNSCISWCQLNWFWLAPVIIYIGTNIANMLMTYSPAASSALRKFVSDITVTTDRSQPVLKLKVPPVIKKRKKGK